MNKLPEFFNYKEEGPTDDGYEAMQDFFLSWTLRCSNSSHLVDNYQINLYARRIVYSLLYGKNVDGKLTVDFKDFESFKVIEIKTKRQFKRIDLLAQLKVVIGDKVESFILNIENKWYTKIGKTQLNDYVKRINENFDLVENKLINVVIFCDETILLNDLTQIEDCLRNDYKFTHISELASLSQMYEYGITGNYLFDEYWLR